MSLHHLECAAVTPLAPSTKLVLMALADSADKETRVAIPGMDQMVTWSGLSKSQTLRVLAWLIDEGYVARLSKARKGHRAEYLVFSSVPCCDQHGPAAGSHDRDPDESEASHARDPEDDPGEHHGSHERDPAQGPGSHNGSHKGSHPDATPPYLRISHTEPDGSAAAQPQPDPDATQSADVESAREPTVNERAQALARAYHEHEPMCRFPAILGIAKKAIQAGRHTDDAIHDALLRLAAEGRPVTVETLRTELDGIPPPNRRPPSTQPTTDQRVASTLALAQKYEEAGQ